MNHPNIYRFSKNITYLLLRLWFRKEASRLKVKEAIAEKQKTGCDDYLCLISEISLSFVSFLRHISFFIFINIFIMNWYSAGTDRSVDIPSAPFLDHH